MRSCVAISKFKFTAEEVGEVAMEEGEQVYVLSRPADPDLPDGWLVVRNADGATGLAPESYLSKVCDSLTL